MMDTLEKTEINIIAGWGNPEVYSEIEIFYKGKRISPVIELSMIVLTDKRVTQTEALKELLEDMNKTKVKKL